MRVDRAIVLSAVVSFVLQLTIGAGEKEVRKEQTPVPALHWDGPFKPTPSVIYGSYCSILRIRDDRFEIWNNTVEDGPEDGLVRFVGTSPREFGARQIVIKHKIINDVFDAEGKLSAKKRFTRPSIVYHPKDGYFAVVHVCDGYPPRDGRVYPASLTSKTGEPDTWTYQGMLKGEIYEKYGPGKGKTARWADGRALFYQPEKPGQLNKEKPLENRFLFFSNQYPGSGCLALLFSADAKSWHFHQKDDKIVNLLPPDLHSKGMIFPHVVRTAKHGWHAWLSEKWPPIAVWHIHSPDGLSWQLFGKQPEIVKPEGTMIKNVSAWYDDRADTIHGYLSVWEDIGGGTLNYRLYHSTFSKF